MDHTIMLYANDVYQLYLQGVPLQKAIRHVQYIMNSHESQQAKKELIKLYNAKHIDADIYRASCIDKRLHRLKHSKGA